MSSLTFAVGGILDGDSEVLSIGGADFTLGTADTQTVTVGGTTFQVVYDGAGGFTITDNGGGHMPLADVELLLAGTTYQNTSDDPTDGDRTIGITVTDPSGDSATATSTVNVDPVNDPPALDLNGAGAGTDIQHGLHRKRNAGQHHRRRGGPERSGRHGDEQPDVRGRRHPGWRQ